MLGTMKVVVVLSLVFLHAGAAPVVAQPEALATESGWWQHAISAAHASIARIRTEAIARGVGEMPEVTARLSQRASGANQRTTTGRVTERDLSPKIPGGVRWAGEKTALEYLDNHHLSHVLSAKNHPELAADPNNLVFEPPKWNLARGAGDMGLLDRLRVNFHNTGASLAAGRVVILTTLTRGGTIGALVELPVTATVETLHVVNERKTPEAAMQDAAKAVGVAGLAGGATVGALTAASALGFTVGAPVLVPLAVVGGTAYVWVSSDRIWHALDVDMRAAVVAQQAAVQGAIRDHARAMRDQTRTTIDTVQERIQTVMAALGWWQ
jgi:hypothetical protein